MWFNLDTFKRIFANFQNNTNENNKQKIVTEFSFVLPRGFVDKEGKIYREGVMRLATAKDEIYVYNHQKVVENPSYAVLVYLSQVIIKLGELTLITPQMLEDLYLLDLAYLRLFYNQINQQKKANIPVMCPYCQKDFNVELNLSGES